MLKCCGCQTNFILSLGGSFLFSKNFLLTPSLTGGLVMPIRRTMQKRTAPEGAVLSQLNSCYYTHIIEFTQFDYFFVTSFWRSRKLPTGTYTVPAL